MNEEIERANKRIAELQHKWETNQEFRYHWDRIMARSQNDKGKSPKQLYPNPFEALGWKGKRPPQNDNEQIELKTESLEFHQSKMIAGTGRTENHNTNFANKMEEFLKQKTPKDIVKL